MNEDMEHPEIKILAALAGVREELARHSVGMGRVGSIGQLQYMESQLECMVEELREGRFQSSRRGISHIIIDSWPLADELGIQICEAVEAYWRGRE